MSGTKVLYNKQLADKRGISEEDQDEIQYTTALLHLVLRSPEKYGSPEQVVQMVEDLEEKLQRLWQFPQDSDYHKYWNKLAGCTCPQLDNTDLYGTGRRWVNRECPFHGVK